ncbi:MAG TPA: hypothetical protein VM223_08265 [Planctomycetota bacterium]|nr:hypothetical protein [Planctomycetota bacterium]
MMQKLLMAAAICAACVLAAGPVRAQDSAAAGDFCEIHRQARKLLDEAPEQSAKLYENFIKTKADAPEAALARVLRGIILWRDLAGMADAEKEFSLAANSPGQDLISAAGARLGKCWQARVRMTRIARACHTYYLDEVAYPENLGELVAPKLIESTDVRDPWGQPFAYMATEAKHTKAARQAYTLTSANVDGDSDTIADALAREKTYARSLALKGIMIDQPAKVMVGAQNQTYTIEIGQTKAGLQPILIQEGRAIICSRDYVVLLAR